MANDVTPHAGSLPAARLLWAAWLAALAVYTYLLVVPSSWLPPWLRASVGQKITDEFTTGKLAHAVVYGLLTLATFALPVRRRGWWVCVAGLSLHGFGTEYVQTFVPGRSGRWLDVGIDHIGIATGLALGGLGRWLRRGRSVGRDTQRVPATPQVQPDAGREDGHADPL
jgi:VanZ family protein